MQRLIIFLSILFLSSCNQSEKTISTSDPLESGREFIDASLKGNFDLAGKYLLSDSVNMMYFDRFKDFNKNHSDQEKEGYKNADIIINSAKKTNDSVMIIDYSNTYKKQPSKIKVVRKNNQWLVDFKYTFEGGE